MSSFTGIAINLQEKKAAATTETATVVLESSVSHDYKNELMLSSPQSDTHTNYVITKYCFEL